MSAELNRAELASLAAIIAGPNASDEAIATNFARAELLLMCAHDWLNSDRREIEISAYILSAAQRADDSDPVLLWSHPTIQAISGYDKTYPKLSPEERAKLLFNAVDKAVGRKFNKATVKTLRTKFREGITADMFRKLWPQLSKWRRGKI